MRYELYIDIFFLVNFVLDFLVLKIVKQMLKCTATHGRILTGAILGAGLASVLTCIPIGGIWKHIVLHGVVNSLMIWVAFQVRKHIFVKAWILLYLVGIMMGGVLNLVNQYIGIYFRPTLLFLFIALGSYELVSKAMDFLEQYFKVSSRNCKAELYLNEECLLVRAIIDTGNMLFDPVTEKPVHIISDKAIKTFTKERVSMIRYISYHTVQNKDSVMPLIKIDKMRIRGKQETEIQSPLLAISECTHFGNGDYDLILHPKDLWEE